MNTKILGVLKNYVGSFSSNVDDNIEKTRNKSGMIFSIHLKLDRREVNLFNPIAYGGPFCPDHQIIDHNSKIALSSTSKLGDFLFSSVRQILVEF